ncbi:MAG TPA: methyltransferase [Candidatus Binatia bacterium]|nr:methyltransferase [Candidatus Binatia bacterium]
MTISRFLRRTPVRTFILYPLAATALELAVYRRLDFHPWFLPIMLWGYLQYRLCGEYRIRRGGGGPGLDVPPERMVMSGPYLYTRNPMYLGHIIYLIGLTLTLHSWFAAAITLARAVWFHFRVLGDEKALLERWGEPYRRYTIVAKRWIPGLF